MNPPSTQIRKRRAPQRQQPNPNQSLSVPRRSARLQCSTSTLVEQVPTDLQTSQPVRATSYFTRLRTSNHSRVSALKHPSPQEYPGPTQPHHHQTRKRTLDRSVEISAERPPKRARLTKGNLKAHEVNLKAMGRRQRKSSGGKLPGAGQTSSSTTTTTTTTNKDFGPQLYQNHVVFDDPRRVQLPDDSDKIKELLNRPRESQSPNEEDYATYCDVTRGYNNEATIQGEAYPLLAKQRIGPGYAKRFNVPWLAVDNHLTVGLSDAKPDIAESFRKTDYPPRAVQELDDALAPSDYDTAMPALAVEVKGFEGSMAVARAQCAYDGALMTNGAHTLHKYVGKSDDNFFGTTQALTIAYDGEDLHLYGHHVPPPQAVAAGSPTVEYHQYLLGRDNPRDSLESFKSAYRHTRNAQEIGYNLAKERKDALWAYITAAETNRIDNADEADEVDEADKVDGGRPLPIPLYTPMSPPQSSKDISCAVKSQKAPVSNPAVAKLSRAIGDSKIRRKSRPALAVDGPKEVMDNSEARISRSVRRRQQVSFQ